MQRGVFVRASDNLHQEKYEIQPGRMDELDRKFLPFRRGQVVEARIIRNALVSPPAATAVAENGYLLELPQGAKYSGQGVRVRLVKIGRSIAQAEVLGKGGGGGDAPPAPAPAPRVPEPQPESRGEGRGGGDNRGDNRGGGGGRRRRSGDRRGGQPREAQTA